MKNVFRFLTLALLLLFTASVTIATAQGYNPATDQIEVGDHFSVPASAVTVDAPAFTSTAVLYADNHQSYRLNPGTELPVTIYKHDYGIRQIYPSYVLSKDATGNIQIFSYTQGIPSIYPAYSLSGTRPPNRSR